MKEENKMTQEYRRLLEESVRRGLQNYQNNQVHRHQDVYETLVTHAVKCAEKRKF